MKTAFRPDIEGLRAVAVLAVVAFHYGIAPFSGGFVGVDVFFVISGYLITSIVAGEIAAERFSILGFYERRLRRLLPALVVVLAACGLASLFVVLPGDLRFVGESLVGAASFTSNLLFASVANDYFAADNLTQSPFLHTWSLSVEAQFYLVFPLLLIAARRMRVPIPAVIFVLLLASFGVSARGVYHRPAATFYLLPTRGWELLIGAALAVWPSRPWRAGAAEGAAASGLALIALAVFAFDRTTPFPGAAALLPCIGTVLIIAAGQGTRPTIAGRLLALPPGVALGRLSYSLYLWHWPVLVLANYGRATGLGVGARVVLLAGTASAAALSWRLVERPFIARIVLPSGRALLAAAAAGTMAVVALGAALDATGRGLLPLAQVSPDVLALANGQFDRIEGECWPTDAEAASGPPCRFGAPGATPALIVWGNSYARMWVPALDLDAARAGTAGLSLVRSKCPPLLDADFADLPDCRRFNAAALDFIRRRPALKSVVLGANWFAFDDFAPALERTLAALKNAGVRVVVVLAPPQAAYSVPRTLALAALRREAPPPPIDEAEARAAQRRSVETIEALRARYGFAVVDPATALCDRGTCAVERNGRPLFYDAGHVTRFAAALSAGLFDAVVEESR